MNLIYDQAAFAKLQDNEFIRKWNRLVEICQYATAFQGPEFVSAWYTAYQDQWKPIIVYDQNSECEFKGLLLLAYDSKSKTLVHAGGEQGEYQVWLSLPGEDVEFLSLAWEELTRQFEFSSLRFRYLPSSEPFIETLKSLPFTKGIGLRKRPRPLMTLNADEIKSSFSKKSNKSRFNRLKKLGQVEFKRIVDIGELNNVFDELIAFYDLRQGAVNLSKPFQEDERKKRFHEDLFKKAGDKVYVTVTYLNGRPIAGFWGLVSKSQVHLGMLMHSPFLAEHSLGKLHLMQLSEQLLNDNFNVLDLTPGSDPWKERFANAHDEVAEAIIYRSVWAKTRSEMIYDVLNRIRQQANRFGLSTADLKAIQKKIRHSRFSIITEMAQWLRSDRKFSVYQIDRSVTSHLMRDERMHYNSLNDLLLFEEGSKGQSDNSFLSAALFRLEQGEKVYTINSDNRLVYCGWMKINQEEQQPIPLPPDSITIHDFYIHPDFRQSGLYKQSLAHLLSEAFSDQKVQLAFVFVPAENKQYLKSVEEMGLSFKSSFVVTHRLGKEKVLTQ